MKKFTLKEITLLSTKERKAKKVRFDPLRTIILGGNSTGKSCLIKSIYETFGATVNHHPGWKSLHTLSLVKFSVDDIYFYFLKDGNEYGIFNESGKIIRKFRSVTKELGPYLANLLDFHLQLPDKKTGELTTLPPAYLFLPYYVDQDNGWTQNWDSFLNLAQFARWREPLIQYHSGITTNELIATKASIEKANEKMSEQEKERKTLKDLLLALQEEMRGLDFNIDIESFKEEVVALLAESEKLSKLQQTLKKRLAEFYETKISLEVQIKITEHAMKEAQKDYDFAVKFADHAVSCPTCGADYDNSFAERFSIAQDEERCQELIMDLNNELSEIEDNIQNENQKYHANMEETTRIRAILEKKQNEVTLQSLIENEGRKGLKDLFTKKIDEALSQMAQIALQIMDLQKKLRSINKINQDKKNEILRLYRNLMRKNTFELDLHNMKEEDYHSIAVRMPERGSAKPRALIAYYLSFLHVIRKYGNTAYCPIIIDSPNQQAQDEANLKKIYDLIRENQPSDSQLILGLESTFGIDFQGKIVTLEKKYSLLEEESYSELFAELTPFINQLLYA